MDPNVVRPNIETIESAEIPSPDSQIVELSVSAGVEREVERWRIHQRQVVNGEIVRLNDTQNARAPIPADFVAVSLESAFAGRAEDLDVACACDQNHVSAGSSGSINDSIPL